MCADCLTSVLLNKAGLRDTPALVDSLSNKVALNTREYADLVAVTGEQATVNVDRFTRDLCPWLNKYICAVFSSDLMLCAKNIVLLPDTKHAFIVMTTALLQEHTDKLYDKKRANIFR